MSRAVKPWIVYLSGPITGKPDFREAFAKAERILRTVNAGQGIYIINPAVRHPPGLSEAEYMELSFSEIRIAHDVALLPGWSDSEGSSLEVKYAGKIGKPCFQMADRFPECYREDSDD